MCRELRKAIRFAAILAGVLGWLCVPGYAQSGSQGAVVVTVADSSGAVVPQAQLELVDPATNTTRRALTLDKGVYTFVNVNIGTYRLTVTKSGYSTSVLESIVVHSAQSTDVVATLQIGKASETVTVNASLAPLLDASTSSIGSVIDLKWIEDLPMIGRDLTAFARLTPGYTGDVTGGAGGTSGFGVWNGQPFSNQGSNVDGVVGSASRGKYNGNVNPAASPRVENIAEMSVVTDQLDLDQGFGQSTMQVNFVTRSGTNKFHGRAYEDARNSGLFANTYAHNVTKQRRDKVIYNDFGGSIGGPILRDKLFFFGSFSTRRVPGGKPTSNNYLTSAMQGGDFTYIGTDGKTYTKNLLSIAGAFNGANGTSLPTSLNSSISSELSAINSALASGATTSTADPNVNEVDWTVSSPNILYFPTVRVDYNLSSKVRMNLAWNMTNRTQTDYYSPSFPGSGFSSQGGSVHSRSYTASYGIDWDITPVMINQFKAGFLYTLNQNAKDAKPLYASQPTVYWGMDNYSFNSAMSGQVYTVPTSNFYPVLNASDSLSWQKGTHSLKMGFSWYREQDHYWNDPQGFPHYALGLAAGDPAINAFTNSASGTLPNASSSNLAEAQQLYAVLTGRISSVYGSNTYNKATNSYSSPGEIHAYNLDERQSAWGLFLQDSWKATPSLTLNYGLRWDFTGDNHDLTGAYHSVSEASIYGPSGVGNLFNPGSFKGTNNPTVDARPHAYSPWNVAPQPAVGFAWNPKDSKGVFGKVFGNGETVIRGGFNLRRFTVPQQYFWDNASSYAAFFYQNFYLNANTTGETGTFTPGSLSLGGTMPAYGLAPAKYLTSEPLSDFTFLNSISVAGIDPHIPQPYTESWNFGVERQFGRGALEVRYNGNRTIHQWIAINPNEVNVFENGFLTEFKKAQTNLAAYMAANPNCGIDGSCSFANNGLSGQVNLPIFDAAFAGSGDYTNSNFVNYVQSGQVGAMANTLAGVAGTTTYFCNLVGSSFAPCVNNAGFTGNGAGYATNFFQANPYAAGTSTSYMVAKGYSNYHAMQVDYRQQSWKGLSFDANYTLGKTLGLGSTRNWTGGGDNIMTLRDMRKGYGPQPFDLRHVLHLSGTYDLPVGKGKAFLSSNNLVSRLLGNWTIGSLMIFQSGAPVQLTGGNATYNDYADGGIVLTGVTRKQLQSAVGVHRIPGKTYANLIDPKYLSSTTGGSANTTYINPNTTPGTIGDVVYLYGPHGFYHDVSLSKTVPIREGIDFKLQSEFLNVWNHPVFGSTPASFGGTGWQYSNGVQSSNFALGRVTNNPRWIELRGNISF